MSIKPDDEINGTPQPDGGAAEWWARYAALVAEKMLRAGVKSFHVDHKGGIKFKFEVIPHPTKIKAATPLTKENKP